MENNNFDTTEKIEAVASNFRTLKVHAGWQMIETILKANIEVLTRQILLKEDNGVKFTEVELDRKRDKLAAYQEVLDTPDLWIKRSETPQLTLTEEPDPYHTVESLQKEKKKGD